MYSGNVQNHKKLDELTLSVEYRTQLGICKTERYGVRLSYLWMNFVKPYAAARIAYYGGYGQKEFTIPLFFDFPPNFLLSPEVAAGFVLGPIVALSLFNYVKRVIVRKGAGQQVRPFLFVLKV